MTECFDGEKFSEEQYRISLFYDLLDKDFKKKYEPKSKIGSFEVDIDFQDFEELIQFAWDNPAEKNIDEIENRILSKVEAAVKYLDEIGGSGTYFIKLNTVSSKDWKIIPITKNNIGSVLEMLMNSMRICELGCINHKINFPDQPLKIIIKDWINITKGTEFRIFVRDQKIIGISRNEASAEPAIRFTPEDYKNILNFCKSFVQGFFEYHGDKVRDIVFDVYFELYDNFVSALNFLETNPCYQSNPCCYTIEELNELHKRISEGYEFSEADIKIDYPEEIKNQLYFSDAA